MATKKTCDRCGGPCSWADESAQRWADLCRKKTMKLVIFDKDGTLICPASGEEFVQHPEDQVLLPGVAEGIAAIAADGYTIVIASNQGGVAAEQKTLKDAIAEMRYCLELLPQVKVAFFCPDFEGQSMWSVPQSERIYIRDSAGQIHYQINADGSPMLAEAKEISADDRLWYARCRGQFRKPAPGMILSAQVWANGLPVEMYVGDRPEDQQAAQAAGVAFQWADEWRASYATRKIARTDW